MRGSKRVLLFVLLALLVAGSVAAQLEYKMPFERTVKPGPNVIKYDNVVYRIHAGTAMSLTFEKMNDRYVQLSARPILGTPVLPFYDFSIEWGGFPPNMLGFAPPGGTYTLDTETGYAEK